MRARLAASVLAALLLGSALVAQDATTNRQALRQHIEDGRRLMRAGDYHGAISQFRHAVRIDARASNVHDHLGWCYLRTSQLRYATDAFTAALTVSPSQLSSRKGLGLAHYRRGQYAESVQALKPAMRDLGYDPSVQLIYGRLLLYGGNAAAALPHLRSAEVPGRPDPALILSIANTYQQLGDAKNAEAHYERVLALDPKHGAAQKGLLQAYKMSKRYSDMRYLLKQLIAEAPNDPVLLRELATVDKALGLHQEALAIYERLSRLVEGPQALDLHVNLAQTYMESGQASLARAHYETAIAQRPNSAALRGGLAECLQALGAREEACVQYGHACTLEPHVAQWQFARGKLLMELGRPVDALGAYQAGLALDPENEIGLTAVADLARELKRPALALESLVALAAARPGNIQIRLALSDVYRELGDVRAANVQAWEVLRADPDSIEARRRLALAAENLGDFEGAIGHLKAIRVIDATNTYYLSPMGRLLAAQGHLAEAIREYELLLERDPESLLIQFDLATLYIKARDTKRAQPLLLAYLSERPQAVWALDQLARCAELEGDFEQALELRRKVALLSPDDRGALDRLVKLYERQGQAHLATDYLVTLMSVPHPPPTAVRVFVHTYRRHSGARAALEQIRGLADIFRHRPVFQQVAAETCAQERLSDEAIVRYAHYLHYQPDDYGAVSQLIALSREAGDMDRCRPLLTRYVERNPGNGPALIALTRISLEVGKPMDAYAAVCTALEADSGGATCHRLLAEVLARLYGTSKAVEVMATRAEASYEPGPRIGLAYAHVLNGAPGEATAVLTAAAESEMTAADAAYVSGLAKNGLGLHKGAVADLARAAAGIDAPPDFRIALARAIDLRTAGIGAMGVRATTRRPGVGG